MNGDQVDIMTKSCHLLPISNEHLKGVPLVGPIWRGKIDIVGSFSGKLEELEVFMSRSSYSKINKVKQSLQPSQCFNMKNRDEVWPRHFDELGAALKDIAFFMLPDISRRDYDNVVEYMISDDQAMTSSMGNKELIVFTSLDLKDNQQQIQGKYYLWGMFKEKGFRRYMSSKVKKTNGKKRPSLKFSHKPLPKMKLYFKKKPPIAGGNWFVDTTPSLVECDSLSLGRKRPGNKKCRVSTILNKEAVQIVGGKMKSVIATDDDDNMSKKDEQSACGVDERLANQDSPLLDRAKVVIIDNETNTTEQHSWDSNMEIDEFSDSFGNNVEETKEADHTSWNKNMEINVSDVVDKGRTVSQETDPGNEACVTPFLNSKELPAEEVPNLAINVERDSCHDLNPDRIPCNNLTVTVSDHVNDDNVNLGLNEGFECDGCTLAVPVVATERKICFSLIPLFDWKKESDRQESNLGVHEIIFSGLDEKLLGTPSDSVVDMHQNIIEDTVPGTSEMSAGLDQRSKCQVYDLLPEQDTCRIPLLDFVEQSRTSAPPAATVVLELEEEGETTIQETEIISYGTEMDTGSSMLKIARDSHETTSDVLVLVGGYKIKSDLAPILTKILDKYGDIASGCSIMPEDVLEKICKTFKNIESASFRDLCSIHLPLLKSVCQYGEVLDIDMKWLSKRIEDLEKTLFRIKPYPSLKKEMVQCENAILSLEEKVKARRASVRNLLQENKLIEEEIASMKECQEKLDDEAECLKSKTRRFVGKSLVDGLV